MALNERVEISHDDFDNHAYFPNQILCPRKKNTDCPRKSHDAERQLPPLSPSRATMSTQSDMSVPDTIRPAFDPHLDIATVVFSHVQCVRTRHSLGALGSRTRAFKQPIMGTCPLSGTCTRTGALGTGTRALGPPITNTGTVCSTRWTTSARSGRNTPRTTRSTSDEIKNESSNRPPHPRHPRRLIRTLHFEREALH